jgi:DNA-binding NtrC family response regulator
MKPTSRKRVLLILENDGFELAKYNAALRSFGFACNGVQTLEKAREFIKSHSVDLVLSDIHLTHDKEDGLGLVFLEEVKNLYPHVIRVAMSKDPKMETAEKVKAVGTRTLLRKPFAPGEHELVIHINRAFEVEELLRAKENKNPLQRALLEKHPEGIILTNAMRKQINVALKEKTLPVTIEGETGTGKEEIVKYIHRRLSQDEEIPLVTINCANLKGDLAASTLFGQ